MYDQNIGGWDYLKHVCSWFNYNLIEEYGSDYLGTK